MIDINDRATLRVRILLLMDGYLTNDEFDEAFECEYNLSDDTGVYEIARYCWCLYSSGTGRPYRLRGPHALGEEQSAVLRRSIRFLETDLEYEWPPRPNTSSLGDWLNETALLLMFCLGVNLILMGLAFLASVDVVLGVALLLAGLLLTGGPAVSYLTGSHNRSDTQDRSDIPWFNPAWPFRILPDELATPTTVIDP